MVATLCLRRMDATRLFVRFAHAYHLTGFWPVYYACIKYYVRFSPLIISTL